MRPDSGEPRHLISVGFFFLFVVAVVALIGLGVLALVRRLRAGGFR